MMNFKVSFPVFSPNTTVVVTFYFLAFNLVLTPLKCVLSHIFVCPFLVGHAVVLDIVLALYLVPRLGASFLFEVALVVAVAQSFLCAAGLQR